MWLWGFQMNYNTSSYLKGLQNCDLSKLEVKKSGVTPVLVDCQVNSYELLKIFIASKENIQYRLLFSALYSIV